MAAAVQVAESLSEVQPRIMQTSAGKNLWARCGSRRRSCGFDTVSPEGLPCHVKQGRACCRGVKLVLCVGGMLNPGCKIELLRLLPGAKRCCGGCLSMQTCLFCQQPAAGWSVIPTNRGGVQAAPSALPAPERGQLSPVPPVVPSASFSSRSCWWVPRQGLAGHTCVLDWQEWDCCSWEPWLTPPTAKWASKDPAKCTVTKNGLLTGTNLKRKWDLPFLLIKSKLQMKY